MLILAGTLIIFVYSFFLTFLKSHNLVRLVVWPFSRREFRYYLFLMAIRNCSIPVFFTLFDFLRPARTLESLKMLRNINYWVLPSLVTAYQNVITHCNKIASLMSLAVLSNMYYFYFCYEERYAFYFISFDILSSTSPSIFL